MDRQTDRQTDRFAISLARVSTRVLTRNKNGAMLKLITGCLIKLLGNVEYLFLNNSSNEVDHITISVRECCKGDEASQWRNPKFAPRDTH